MDRVSEQLFERLPVAVVKSQREFPDQLEDRETVLGLSCRGTRGGCGHFASRAFFVRTELGLSVPDDFPCRSAIGRSCQSRLRQYPREFAWCVWDASRSRHVSPDSMFRDRQAPKHHTHEVLRRPNQWRQVDPLTRRTCAGFPVKPSSERSSIRVPTVRDHESLFPRPDVGAAPSSRQLLRAPCCLPRRRRWSCRPR